MSVLRFTVPGAPVPAARPRAVPLMRNGRAIISAGGRPIIHAFVPDATTNYEKLVADYAARAASFEGWVKPEQGVRLGLVLRVYRVARRGDLDNFYKSAADGITKSGVVWDDDRYVVSARVAMAVSRENPRMEVEVHLMPEDNEEKSE